MDEVLLKKNLNHEIEKPSEALWYGIVWHSE